MGDILRNNTTKAPQYMFFVNDMVVREISGVLCNSLGLIDITHKLEQDLEIGSMY